MKLRMMVGVTGAAAVLIGISGFSWFGGDKHTRPATGSEAVSVGVPAGVTLQPLGKSQGYDLGKSTASAIARDQIAYTDLRGLTLYTWEKDPPGQATCDGDCAERFKPFLAQSQVPASLEPGWSLIERADGGRQWALHDKALYTYVKDVDPGSLGGDSPANYGAPRLNRLGVLVGGGFRGGYQGGREEVEPMPEGWRAALLYPFDAAKLPPGMAIKEVPDAAGFVLVDGRGHTLYALRDGDAVDGERCAQQPCRRWQPVAASRLAQPLGDFTAIDRADGIRQWTFKGQPLYSYEGDLAPTYANGIGVDERMQVAQVMRYYLPEQVSIRDTVSQGKVLATAAGMTLYRRDGHILQSGGGHNLRRGQPARPAVGRDIGTEPRCDAACQEHWHPFVAPDDAQPRGFWDVATRDDGRRQWVYQGYALWTYAGDKQPGDMQGHDVYDLVVSDDPEYIVDVGTPMDGSAALWWSIAIP